MSDTMDLALKKNRQAERMLLVSAGVTTAVGVLLLTWAVTHGSASIAALTFLWQSTLAWPLAKMVRLRKENVALETIPHRTR